MATAGRRICLVSDFMSEHEFEQFLALFRGMLRLNPAQRDEIAAELMDHLQERLAELSDRGMPRDKAVKIALEEFGDAAGLAAQFVLVLSQQRRRRIMKWTASSVVVVMMLLFGAYAFWPANPVRGPLPVVAIAQEPAAGAAQNKTEPAKEAPAAPAPKPDTIQEIETLLAQKQSANFDQIPLEDFLNAVGENAKVDFYLDKSALGVEGIAIDSPITLNLKSIRFDRLLDLVLTQAGLGWEVQDGYVLVTSKSKLEETLETRVYNCRDLVEMMWFGSGGAVYGGESGSGFGSAAPSGAGPAMGPGMMSSGGGMPGGMPGMMPGAEGSGMVMAGIPTSQPYMGTLISVITTTVLPESWAEQGGPGSVAAYHGGLLVVNHHAKAHQKIDQLLKMLREASKDRPGAVVRER